MSSSGLANYLFEPGHTFFARGPAVARTVLGSCVAVCLWDGGLRYGGINHFLYPSTSGPADATAQYGNVAMAALVQMMEDAGFRRNDLKGQILGGGHPEGATGQNIGQGNARVARDVLSRSGIKLVSEDVGSTLGRKIVLDTATVHVAALKVHQIRQSDWIA